ncbi:glycosyltransferase family 4 protein [Sabulilitoribacter multivorans]|uniref:Glycosyltransferase family 4 protein n=1 Tax=Flaviramulus multivorans TaxID=1304750 RepID=A0ABS9IHT7_9FLAO|nr:glycosyltransferase family 1 protein [Flaviramulus multivorans]MCF7560326.1 glycosyltransferase family 4 protein [Flaviramulus multivorans]
MAERKRIGFRFSYNENWIAGSYYILNIIHALNTLEDEKKPKVVILSETIENFNIVKNETNYPFLEYFIFPFPKLKYNLLQRAINKLSRVVFRKNLITKLHKQPNIDFLYPNHIDAINVPKLKKVNWVPDFQEEHLPQFFSKKEIERRKHIQKEIYCNGDIVVLSSLDAEKDFKRLYPRSKAKTFVLNFAVTHPNFNHIDSKKLLNKYNLNDPFFFSPNQFWAHKNHMVILKAIKKIKDNNRNILVLFSGKESDFRNSENFNLIKSYIAENQLENYVKLLGFIDREEQLCLMSKAIAIIQPSLFEGWSTVVEDAKALNKFIILSNLAVHLEQINKNVHFFSPNNHEELGQILDKYNKEYPETSEFNYKESIYKFAEKFMDLTSK